MVDEVNLYSTCTVRFPHLFHLCVFVFVKQLSPYSPFLTLVWPIRSYVKWQATSWGSWLELAHCKRAAQLNESAQTHIPHTHTHTHPLGHFPVLISKYICSSSCWGPAGKTVGGIEDERKSRMHGELRLYTLLPLTHTYTRLFTTSDIRTGKVDSAEGSGMEQAGSAHNSQHTHCCCSRAGEGGKAWLMSFMPSCLTWKWIKLLCVIKCFVRVDLLVILVKGMKRDCSARYLKPLSQNTKHVYGNSHSSK